MSEIKNVIIFKREEFRKWLRKYGKSERRVAVILHKRHTGKSAPTHRELIEEAICFGWIDTTIKRLNEDTFLRNFARRTESSKWSDNTLKYAKQLLKAGKMTADGLRFYKLGLKKPTHDHGIPKNPAMPDDLKALLSKDVKARKNFDEFPPSTKRMLFRWLLRAKLPATKKKRAKQIVRAAKKLNKKFLKPTGRANT